MKGPTNGIEFRTPAEHYQEQADAADSPRVATIFRLLADTEPDHAAYFRLQLRRLDDREGC